MLTNLKKEDAFDHLEQLKEFQDDLIIEKRVSLGMIVLMRIMLMLLMITMMIHLKIAMKSHLFYIMTMKIKALKRIIKRIIMMVKI